MLWILKNFGCARAQTHTPKHSFRSSLAYMLQPKRLFLHDAMPAYFGTMHACLFLHDACLVVWRDACPLVFARCIH